jgi:predicted amidohydrolase
VLTVNIEPASNLTDIMAALDGLSPLGALDLVVLPESSLGVGPDAAQTLDGEVVAALADFARTQRAYVLAGLYLTHDGADSVSAILLDRAGAPVGLYDKRYPYWAELDLEPRPRPGTGTPAWHTDFGILGAAICFDINFPQVWADLADAGVDLVVWPSAYAGGTVLGSYAQIHHYHVLSCTQAGDSRLYDPTGDECSWAPGPTPQSRMFDIDLDVGVYHHNFNADALRRLMADHGDDLFVDATKDAEQWYVLRKRRPEVNVRELARAYHLEELRDYIRRSRTSIDCIRHCPEPADAGAQA